MTNTIEDTTWHDNHDKVMGLIAKEIDNDKTSINKIVNYHLWGKLYNMEIALKKSIRKINTPKKLKDNKAKIMRCFEKIAAAYTAIEDLNEEKYVNKWIDKHG